MFPFTTKRPIGGTAFQYSSGYFAVDRRCELFPKMSHHEEILLFAFRTVSAIFSKRQYQPNQC